MPHLDIETARRFLRDELPPAERSRWAVHVADCATCRDLLANERAFASMLRLGDDSPTENNVPSEAADALERTLAAAEGGDRPPSQWWRVALASLVLLGLMGGLWWQVNAGPDPHVAEAASLRISPELQARVVAQLEALRILQFEPWLATDYQAVLTLDEYLREEGWP